MFQKEGLNFFTIGGQVNNSSSRDRESIDRAFSIIKRYEMNTAAFPIYWSTLEPEENTFDYSQVDYIIDGAVKNEFEADAFMVRYLEEWSFSLCAPLGEKRSCAVSAYF